MKNMLLTLVMFFLLSSCITLDPTRTVEISYTPQSGVIKLPGAETVGVRVQINDRRQQDDQKNNIVSRKKGLSGLERSYVIASEDVIVTIRKAMEEELQARGFLFGGEPGITVVGDLNRFSNELKAGFFRSDSTTNLDLIIAVKNREGKTLFSRALAVKDTDAICGMITCLALRQVLENGMKMLFDDKTFIAALMRVRNQEIQ